MNRLSDLTGQESGIIIFENNDAIICNWECLSPIEGGIPRLFAGLLIACPSEFELVEQGTENDFASFGADDWNIIYDLNGDALTMASTSESWKWYKIKESRTGETFLVIAPENWN